MKIREWFETARAVLLLAILAAGVIAVVVGMFAAEWYLKGWLLGKGAGL